MAALSFFAARALLREAVDARVTPCAAAEVGRRTGALWREAAGRLTYEADAPPATSATVFDLASLSKVIATAPMAMRLVESGRLALDALVAALVPGWRGAERAGVTVRDLLEHCSGLPAVLPLYEDHAGRRQFEEAICRAELEYPPRTTSLYSDLGFILLGFLLADAARQPLDAQFRDVAECLDLSEPDCLVYGPLAVAGRDRVAPTQVDEWRGGRLLRGEVDDRNTAALGGIAGHSGLFGTVTAVGAFARRMLRGRLGDSGNRLAAPATIGRFLARTSVPGSSRALAWDTMLPTSSCGVLMSREAFGHTGFTGTSLWIDPVADVYVVLLTNRVYPKAGDGERIRLLRRAFHDAVMKEVY